MGHSDVRAGIRLFFTDQQEIRTTTTNRVTGLQRGSWLHLVTHRGEIRLTSMFAHHLLFSTKRVVPGGVSSVNKELHSPNLRAYAQ